MYFFFYLNTVLKKYQVMLLYCVEELKCSSSITILTTLMNLAKL